MDEIKVISNKEYRKLKRLEEKQRKENKIKPNKEFSKVLLIQESALVWIITISFIVLSFYCVFNQYFGELPWLMAMVGFPWTAYGVSQAMYYNKSKKENTVGGIKFETALASLNQNSFNSSNNNQNSNNNNTYNTYNNSYNSGTEIKEDNSTVG